MFTGEGRLADVDNKSYRVIAFFLLEGSSEARSASVAMDAEGLGPVGNRTPVGGDKIGGVASSTRKTRMVSNTV